MKILLAGIASMIIALPAFAENNPDEGKLLRLVCFGYSYHTGVKTIDTNHVVIVQLANNEDTDASNYLPGNSNYMPGGTPVVDFDVFIYENAQAISTDTNVVNLSNTLLESEPTFRASSTGNSRNGAMGVYWNNDYSAVIYYPGEEQRASVFSDGERHRGGAIHCKPPFSVADRGEAATD